MASSSTSLSRSPLEQTVALLGPNGAGKSTAVAALAGLVPIDSGTIALAGTVLDDPGGGVLVPPEARSVGVVFQDYLLFPHLSVIENVAFGLRSRGVVHDAALARAGEWLERLGVADQARSKPGTLSGGQAQRVALARALVTEPELLLLDEPLSALDVTTRVQLRRVLAEHLEGFAGPRLLITHDPTEAFLLADLIHIIEDGAITQTGTADDIRLRPRTTYAADLAGANLFLGVAHDGICPRWLTPASRRRSADHRTGPGDDPSGRGRSPSSGTRGKPAQRLADTDRAGGEPWRQGATAHRRAAGVDRGTDCRIGSYPPTGDRLPDLGLDQGDGDFD